MAPTTLTLATWVHDLDPVAFGPVRWYGLSYILGFFLAFLLMRRVARVGISPIAPAQVADLVLWVGIGILLGGRLGYALFYSPALFVTFSTDIPFWQLLNIREGGMASHGGMLGGVVAALIFAHRHGLDRFFLLDMLAFGGPLGLAAGRVANFINGELIGRPAPEKLPWAVKFPQEIRDWPDERQLQLYDALPPPGQVRLELQQWHPATIVQLMRDGERQVIDIVEPMLTARHPSQLYAAVLEGLVVFAVLLFVWRKPRVPGLIASLFAITYACGRILNEFFRQPDAHIIDAEFALLGVTRGQWLSLLLLAVGVWGLWYTRRRKAQPMGGWRKVA